MTLDDFQLESSYLANALQEKLIELEGKLVEQKEQLKLTERLIKAVRQTIEKLEA